jgi:hypothetical protein
LKIPKALFPEILINFINMVCTIACKHCENIKFNLVLSEFFSSVENFIKGVPIDELAYYPRQRFIENERSVSLDYENILKQLS